MPSLNFKIEQIPIGSIEYQIRMLLDQGQYDDPLGIARNLGISSTAWPFFGKLWPSSLVLAEIMEVYPLDENIHILEIGCGLALASMVAHRRRANITASDYHPSVESFLNKNLELNDLPPLPFALADWNSQQKGNLGQYDPFDLIIGSEVLYDREHPEMLARFIDLHLGPKGKVIIIDPGREQYKQFIKEMVLRKFKFSDEKYQNRNQMRNENKNEAKIHLLQFERME